ncbi:MAG: HAMP domain-containing histidine kinase [Acidobacteria bacterium]|nr:HAMP domain-containing histidine kinase [Acidobacteriota bacterium]
MPAMTTESYPRLLSLAVHEIRTPVGIVGGYLRMLLRDTESTLPARQRRMLEEAEKSCARIGALVAELSDVGRIDAGLVPLAHERFDLFALLEDVAGKMHEASDREVRFELDGPPSGAPMSGDPARIRESFQSIFRAILREQPSACTVVASRRIALVAGVRAAVVVAAEASSVQAAYAAAPGPFDEMRGGLGLALPIARRVIEAHGGSLAAPAASGGEAPGVRSAAIVALPLRS